MEIHTGSVLSTTDNVKEDPSGWTITVKSIRVDKARMTDLLNVMKCTSAEEFAFMLHLATGMKIGSRDSRVILNSFLRLTSKYDEHKKVIREVAHKIANEEV